jgi:ERCC4-type nuclease
VHTKNLTLGDFQIIQNIQNIQNTNMDKEEIYKENVEENEEKSRELKAKIHLIIERKSIKDLAASIKDGRYLEQKKRLLSFRQQNPHVKLAYILEGHYTFNPSFISANVGNKSLSGAIINSMIRDDIILWKVENEKETIDLIQNIFDRYTMDVDKYTSNIESSSILGPNQYIDAAIASFNGIHNKKKDNIDPKLCTILQLSCIPGVSSKKATQIVEHLN